MGAISNTERRNRLRSLAETVYSNDPPGIHPATLLAAACKEWGITKRTASEYLEVLTNSKILAHDPPGGPLHLTPAGEKWLDVGGEIVSPPDAVKIVSFTRKPPSPPTSTTEGGVENDAEEPRTV